MPFYDLLCEDCDKEFNIRASVADKTEKNISCPECGGMNMKTVYNSAPAYIKSRDESKPACPQSSMCGANCRFAG